MASRIRLRAALALALVFPIAAPPVSAAESLSFSFRTYDDYHCILSVTLGNLVPATTYVIDVDGLNGPTEADVTFYGTATIFAWYTADDGGLRSPRTHTILDASWTDAASDTYSKTYYPKIRIRLYADETLVLTKTVSNRCVYTGP